MAVIYRFVFETEEAMQVPSGQIPVLSYQKKKKKKKKKEQRKKKKKKKKKNKGKNNNNNAD